jgi:DNA-binding GntR family transcriptional regulator
MDQRRETDGHVYQNLSRQLRSSIIEGQYSENDRLPTEAELSEQHRVSRQTVRRAMQELVAEGLVFRVPGRGTFPTPRRGRYLRQFGSIEDLMGLSLDTVFELVAPLHRRVDLEAAGRLGLASDNVLTAAFRRLHEDVAFCFTTVYLPPELGAHLQDVPELHDTGSLSRITVIGLLDERLPTRIAEAEQSITVAPTPAAVATALACAAGDPALRIDRIYWSAPGTPVELAISYFRPELYSYRVRLRRSV